MIIVSRTQFHVERLWGLNSVLNVKAVVSRFQLGEGPSRGLLRDYEPSDGSFWSTTCVPPPQSVVEPHHDDHHDQVEAGHHLPQSQY